MASRKLLLRNRRKRARYLTSLTRIRYVALEDHARKISKDILSFNRPVFRLARASVRIPFSLSSSGRMSAPGGPFHPIARSRPPSRLPKRGRKHLTATIPSGVWDAIIVTHRSFERIGMPREYQQDFRRGQIAECESLLLEAGAAMRMMLRPFADVQTADMRNPPRPRRLQASGRRSSRSWCNATTASAPRRSIPGWTTPWPSPPTAGNPLAELRDKLKTGLSVAEPAEGSPSVAELAGQIKTLRGANVVEPAPARTGKRRASAEEPVTSRIVRKARRRLNRRTMKTAGPDRHGRPGAGKTIEGTPGVRLKGGEGEHLSIAL